MPEAAPVALAVAEPVAVPKQVAATEVADAVVTAQLR